eukprot:scaffold108107_cov50-Cyclotella_meneghiniana.AAC.2
MQSVKTHEGQGPNLNTILTPSTSLIRHRRFHRCPLLRPCVALSDFGKLHTFDLFTLASSSSANSENILKTATSE